MLPTTRHNAFLGVEHLSSQSLMFTQWQNIAFVGSNTLVIQTQEQAKSKWSTTPRYCPSLQDITLWLNYHIDGQHYDGVPALKADGCKDVAIQDTVAQKPLVLHTGFSTFFNSDSNKGEKRCWRRSEIQETTWRQTCASRFMSLTKNQRSQALYYWREYTFPIRMESTATNGWCIGQPHPPEKTGNGAVNWITYLTIGRLSSHRRFDLMPVPLWMGLKFCKSWTAFEKDKCLQFAITTNIRMSASEQTKLVSGFGKNRARSPWHGTQCAPVNWEEIIWKACEFLVI